MSRVCRVRVRVRIREIGGFSHLKIVLFRLKCFI